MRLLPVFSFILIGLCLITMVAEARVDILPRRVIFESRDRTGDLTLLNIFDKPSTIRISLLNYRQDENGIYTELDEPLNPKFNPEDVLRLSPRQFTLPPNGRQIVRFGLRKPADLPEGEYRFHIMALRMANYGPPAPVGNDGPSVQTTTNIGAAIPIIIRHGNLSATAKLSDPQFIPENQSSETGGKPTIKVTVNRDGNASVLGTLRAYWHPTSGTPSELGFAGNVNVFTEITKRHAVIPLSFVPQGPGTIKIIYTDDENDNAVLSEISMAL